MGPIVGEWPPDPRPTGRVGAQKKVVVGLVPGYDGARRPRARRVDPDARHAEPGMSHARRPASPTVTQNHKEDEHNDAVGVFGSAHTNRGYGHVSDAFERKRKRKLGVGEHP